MEKSEKHCSNCNTKYSVSWDEENESVIPDEADHDSWN